MPKTVFNQITIGIDEVGRGPLAGPVVVCALMISGRLRFPKNIFLPPLRDSKKLNSRQREIWHDWIDKHSQISYAVARIYPRRIEKLNISQAANLAATRAVNKLLLLAEREGWGGVYKIFLDGGLYLNFETPAAKTVIKGDEKINAIKLASIVAKVTRDRAMDRLHKKYPEYGFDKHRGYGTAVHLAALKKYGPSKIHRVTFLKNLSPTGC